MTAAVLPAPGRPVLTSRVSVFEGAQHTLTVAWRSLVQVRHNPMELLDLSVQPIMFALLFTYVFGGAIAGSTDAYLQFSLAGLIVQNSLFTTLNTGVGLNSDLHKGVFDRLRSLPIARSAPLAGRIVADMVKQVWSVSVLLGVGMLIGFRPTNGILGVLGAYALLIVFGLAFSWVAVMIGTLVSEPEKVQMFGFVVILPLTFASNAFVPTVTMPGWLQSWVKINPVTILADALRGLMVSGPVATPVLQSLAWAACIAVVFAPLAAKAFKRWA